MPESSAPIIPVWAMAALAAVFILLTFMIGWQYLPSHDVLAELQIARDFMAGLSVNDPYFIRQTPITFLRHIPIVIAESFFSHVDTGKIITAFNFFLIVLSGGVSYRILKRLPALSDTNTVFLLAFAYLIPAALLSQIQLHSNLGQRDHWLCILIMPYLFSTLARITGELIPRYLRIVAGILGAIAICLKPHYLIFFVTSELFLMFRARHLWAWCRIEAGIILMSGVCYLLLWKIFFTAYFDEVMNYAGVVGSFMGFLGVKILLKTLKASIIPGVSLSVVLFDRQKGFKDAVFYFFSIFMAAAICYVTQGRDYSHQLYPVMFFTFILCGVAFARLSPVLTIVVFALCTLIYSQNVQGIPFGGLWQKAEFRARVTIAANELRPFIEGQKVAILNPTVNDVWQVLGQSGARVRTPLINLSFITSMQIRANKYDISGEALSPYEIFFQQKLSRFILDTKPQWVLVGNLLSENGEFTTLNIMARDAAFYNEWKMYEVVKKYELDYSKSPFSGQNERKLNFALYKRKDHL